MLNPKRNPLPTEEELHEPDRRLDELISYIRSQDDPASVAKWFVEGIMGDFGLPLWVGDPDPVRNWEALSQATVWALHDAAQGHKGRRTEFARAARDHLLEVFDELKYWREEETQH